MMKFSKIRLCYLFAVFISHQAYSQAIFTGNINDAQSLKQNMPGCGSHELLKSIHNHHPETQQEADQWIQSISHLAKGAGTAKSNHVYEIPVVFHIVYGNEAENLPDSVIQNQLQILNDCFRRTNADTINLRPEFLNLVGDANIEFKLAEFDPEGLPTNGIVRTSTNVEYFGGVLPYSPGQNAQILQWFNDSLFYNFFRITDTAAGGQDAWNTNEYLNIWVGDLRIFEPGFNNFEELIFFGLATPPLNHFNWPQELLPVASNLPDGVIMHYVNIGSNNPNNFPTPYNIFNGITNTGKMLVHEVGHYLGLRHIWGDGNCSQDDFIDDTPRASMDSQYTCDANLNHCVDDIDGIDLPNMIENYMDYSSGDCQNAFTKGQIDLMRSVLLDYRPELTGVIVSLKNEPKISELKLYPNPTQGHLTLDFTSLSDVYDIQIRNLTGQLVHRQSHSGSESMKLTLNLNPGMYLIQLSSSAGAQVVERFVVE